MLRLARGGEAAFGKARLALDLHLSLSRVTSAHRDPLFSHKDNKHMAVDGVCPILPEAWTLAELQREETARRARGRTAAPHNPNRPNKGAQSFLGESDGRRVATSCPLTTGQTLDLPRYLRQVGWPRPRQPRSKQLGW